MSRQEVLWALLPPQLRRLPADLAAILGWAFFVNISIFLPGVSETPLRVVLGLPYVLFIPGHAFIAALFPEAGASSPVEEPEQTNSDSGLNGMNRDAGIDGIERVALSFGLSIAVVPLIGLVLNFTPWGIRLAPIMIAINVFVVSMTALAATRRWSLPPEDRFAVPYRTWFHSARAELLQPASRTDAVLNVVLIISVLLAVGSVGYAVAVPKEGESFTEFYLLTENENGELVADGYPTEFQQGEPRQLTVGIGNQEYEQVEYTVVIELQRVTIVDNQTRIQDTNELRRYQPTVQHNKTWQRQHTVAPQMTGERLRLQYLLYRDDPGSQVNRSDAYRELHLWVNVTG